MVTDFYYLSDELKDILRETVYIARVGKENIEIGICGEHINYLENVEFFKSLGINYLNANPQNILRIKELVDTKPKEHILKLDR